MKRLANVATFTLLLCGTTSAVRPAFSQSTEPLRIARLDFMEPPLLKHFSNSPVSIPLSQRSVSLLSHRGIRVRAIRGRREDLLRMKADADSCVTIPAFSYPVDVGRTSLDFNVNKHWLQRDRDGSAQENVYLLVFEFRTTDAGFVRVKRADLVKYLDAGFPIVIAPPEGYTHEQLVALGQEIGTESTPVVVRTCYQVASLLDEGLELVASPCGTGSAGTFSAALDTEVPAAGRWSPW